MSFRDVAFLLSRASFSTASIYKFSTVCLTQFLSAPRREALAIEVPREGSFPREGISYVFKAI